MGITENAAYLKGLFDGYEIDTNTKEGRILSEMITILGDMADKIAALEADNKELHEYVEELDHDLGDVEEELYFGEDFDDEDYPARYTVRQEIHRPSCSSRYARSPSMRLPSALPLLQMLGWCQVASPQRARAAQGKERRP